MRQVSVSVKLVHDKAQAHGAHAVLVQQATVRPLPDPALTSIVST